MTRLALLLALGLATAATAQTVYRWIDPATGRATVSDQPPPPGVKATVSAGAAGESGADPALPYETRIAAEKYPVTLYTGPDCGSLCDQARRLLKGRGIPFREQAISNAEELETLKKVSGDTQVPVLMVGKEIRRGFAAGPWDALLDLAGYPKTAPAGR